MKHLRWLPLAFLADINGYAVFAPYAALMMALAIVLQHQQQRRRNAQVLALVPVRA